MTYKEKYCAYIHKSFKQIWKEFEDVLFDEVNGELILSEDWEIYDKGTSREYIWASMEEIFGIVIGEYL